MLPTHRPLTSTFQAPAAPPAAPSPPVEIVKEEGDLYQVLHSDLSLTWDQKDIVEGISPMLVADYNHHRNINQIAKDNRRVKCSVLLKPRRRNKSDKTISFSAIVGKSRSKRRNSEVEQTSSSSDESVKVSRSRSKRRKFVAEQNREKSEEVVHPKVKIVKIRSRQNTDTAEADDAIIEPYINVSPLSFSDVAKDADGDEKMELVEDEMQLGDAVEVKAHAAPKRANSVKRDWTKRDNEGTRRSSRRSSAKENTEIKENAEINVEKKSKKINWANTKKSIMSGRPMYQGINHVAKEDKEGSGEPVKVFSDDEEIVNGDEVDFGALVKEFLHDDDEIEAGLGEKGPVVETGEETAGDDEPLIDAAAIDGDVLIEKTVEEVETGDVDEPMIEEGMAAGNFLIEEPLIEEGEAAGEILAEEPMVDAGETGGYIFIDEPLIEEEGEKASDVLVEEPMIEEDLAAGDILVQESLIEEGEAAGEILAEEPLIEEEVAAGDNIVQESLIEEGEAAGEILAEEPLIEEGELADYFLVQEFLVEDGDVADDFLIEEPVIEEGEAVGEILAEKAMVDETLGEILFDEPMADEGEVAGDIFAQESLIGEGKIVGDILVGEPLTWPIEDEILMEDEVEGGLKENTDAQRALSLDLAADEAMEEQETPSFSCWICK